MSDATRSLASISPLQTPKSPYIISSKRLLYSPSASSSFGSFKINPVILKPLFTSIQQASTVSIDSSSPVVSLDLKPILNESQFNHVIAEEPILILWMANWCRKCIYLKPKLEKLAASYHPRVRFYCIDVNNVPYQLVVRAGVTKMPTIQLWKDCKKQAEVIGGHKAYLVANEVREMIDNEGQT